MSIEKCIKIIVIRHFCFYSAPYICIIMLEEHITHGCLVVVRVDDSPDDGNDLLVDLPEGDVVFSDHDLQDDLLSKLRRHEPGEQRLI